MYMKTATLHHAPKLDQRSPLRAIVLLLLFLLAGSTVATFAQSKQLSLADILIALRSKKVTLIERNKILTDAIANRGTTFSLTPEIEKELEVTGADKSLIESIRQKGQIIGVAAVNPPSGDTKPKSEIGKPESGKSDPGKPDTGKPEPVVSSVPAPDHTFYEKRAEASVNKGDVDSAISDFTKAIELDSSSVPALLGRASIYSAKGSYTLAITDYTKVIELAPTKADAYARRGEAHEKKGSPDLAAADYRKALDLDPSNELAKTNGAKYITEKKAEEKTAVTKTPAVEKPKRPEFVDLGQLTEAQAVRMAKPVYSSVAMKSNIGGRVVVDVEIDLEGNVTSAKMTSGSPFLKQISEDAARRSKFKPGSFDNVPIKARGTIVYNFVSNR